MYLVTSHDSVQKKTSSLQKIIPTRISFEELAQIIAIPPSQGTFLPSRPPPLLWQQASGSPIYVILLPIPSDTARWTRDGPSHCTELVKCQILL